MENIEIIENSLGEEFVLIRTSENEFSGMSKAEYDRRQVEHLTEIPTPSEA